jgi:hypothetical protein
MRPGLAWPEVRACGTVIVRLFLAGIFHRDEVQRGDGVVAWIGEGAGWNTHGGVGDPRTEVRQGSVAADAGSFRVGRARGRGPESALAGSLTIIEQIGAAQVGEPL